MSTTIPFKPAGYHTVTPYLYIKGASKAIEFYKTSFGAIEEVRMDQADGRVGHAELLIGDSRIMLADEFPEMGVLSPTTIGDSGLSIVLYVEDCDAMIRTSVENGATLTREIEDKFYGDRAGAIKDPFGHTWHIMTHKRDMTPEEMKEAMQKLEG